VTRPSPADSANGDALSASGAGTARPVFYFDLGSPYAYLAAVRIERVLGVDPEWQPISLGGLFKLTGRGSWGEGEGRARGMAEVERRAAEYRLPPVRWPEPWPGHMLLAMRAAVAARQDGRLVEYARAAFTRAFARGRDLSDPEEVLAAAGEVGLDPRALREAVGRREVKDELRTATEAAAALGVIGVPTVRVGAALFWGDDRLEEAAAAFRQ
jgi:2-hydroxychromene-2-carboxylate isomerase